MIVKKSTVTKLDITEAPKLDTIRVYIENYEPGLGSTNLLGTGPGTELDAPRTMPHNAELCGVPSGTSERAPGYAAGGNGE